MAVRARALTHPALAAALYAMLVLAIAPAWARPPAEVVQEMDGLIQALGDSGCSFERNGRWYDSERAAEHLQRKQAWLLRRDLVQTTAQFIERAGTGSSLSGKPYHVRCGDGPTVPSAQWLQSQLERIRLRTSPSR